MTVTKRKYKFSEETRARMSEAQKRRAAGLKPLGKTSKADKVIGKALKQGEDQPTQTRLTRETANLILRLLHDHAQGSGNYKPYLEVIATIQAPLQVSK